MKNGVLIFFCCMCWLACSNREHIPRNVLSKEKMQDVLWDLMRADQFFADFLLINDTAVNRDSARIRLYRQVLAIHKISREEFKRSFDFYNARPALMKALMDSIAGRKEIPRPAGQLKPDSLSVVSKIPVPDSPSLKVSKDLRKTDTATRPKERKRLQVE